MPLSAKGEEILACLRREYGAEKGKQVLYAGKNAGTFTGIDSRLERLDAVRKSLVKLSIDGRRLRERVDAEFREGDHPRAEDGRFGDKGASQSGATVYKPGKVSYSDEMPSGAQVEEQEFEDEETGRAYQFDVGFMTDAESIDAVIGGLHILDEETGEYEPAEVRLGKVEFHKLKRRIAKSIEESDLVDRAEGETEESRWNSLTEEEQGAETETRQKAEAAAQQAKSKEIAHEIDDLLAKGWKPEFNEAGGLKASNIPVAIKQYASPSSMKKIRDHLRERGFAPETK